MKISFISQVWKKFRSYFSQDVPTDISVCEFECRKLSCTQEEWEGCENRQKIINKEL